MYTDIKKGDMVVYKEGAIFDWCLVSDIYYTDNNGHGQLQHFVLLSKLSCTQFEVTICEGPGSAYASWRFVPASELTSHDYPKNKT